MRAGMLYTITGTGLSAATARKCATMPSRRPHVIGHDDERADDAGHLGERIGRADRRVGVVRTGADDHAAARGGRRARTIVSMTARFSSASSELASPVVPSATIPLTPAAMYSWHSRSIAATSTAPLRVERRDERNPDAVEIEVARHAQSVVVPGPPFPENAPGGGYLPPRAARPRDRAHGRWSAWRPACCRGCSVSAARSCRHRPSGPSARRRCRPSARRCRRSCPSSISGSLRYRRENYILRGSSRSRPGFGVPASVVGSRLSDAVPGNGHALMLLTAALVGVHRVPHRVPDRPHPRTRGPTARPTNGGASPSSVSPRAGSRGCSASAAAS